MFYALPVLNAAAALTMEEAVRGVRGNNVSGKDRSVMKRWVKTVLVGLLAMTTLGLSFLQTVVSTGASSRNYPAAHALRSMQKKEGATYREMGICEQEGRVHIDAECAMNGISQFLQLEKGRGECPKWVYSKREGVGEGEWRQYTHLVTARRSVDGFCLVHVERGFAGVDWTKRTLRMSERAFVLRNLNVSDVSCLDR